ncbi:hypothetical protein MSZK_22550 [Mycobacterium sp. shizuoka-1]|nr:hypothetical protein MSZK_22550 [Mycobacterium sp. shizuoka-1]
MTKSLLMGMDEFFELTGVPVNTQKDWRAKGGRKGPPSAVIAGKLKYRRVDVMTWIDEQFEQPAKHAANAVAEFSPLGKRALTRAAS